MKTVSIVGGGLVGALFAVFLRRRDNPVVVYEARADPRVGHHHSARQPSSIASRSADSAFCFSPCNA